MIRICSLWSSENVQWKNGSWTWGECQLVAEICKKWGTSDFPWRIANFKWSECSGSIQPIPPIPVVTVGNLPGVDATTLIQPWLEEPWNPYRTGSYDKHKRLIKLVCKVKNEEYKEEKEMKDFKVTVGDIRMVVKAVSGVELNINLDQKARQEMEDLTNDFDDPNRGHCLGSKL